VRICIHCFSSWSLIMLCVCGRDPASCICTRPPTPQFSSFPHPTTFNANPLDQIPTYSNFPSRVSSSTSNDTNWGRQWAPSTSTYYPAYHLPQYQSYQHVNYPNPQFYHEPAPRPMLTDSTSATVNSAVPAATTAARGKRKAPSTAGQQTKRRRTAVAAAENDPPLPSPVVPGVGPSAPLSLDNMPIQHHPAMMAGSRDGTTRIYGSILAETREVTTAAASDVWWFTRKLESDAVPLTLPTDDPPRYKTKPNEKKFTSVACRNCLKECGIIFSLVSQLIIYPQRQMGCLQMWSRTNWGNSCPFEEVSRG
jgi:hypothetical protein